MAAERKSRTAATVRRPARPAAQGGQARATRTSIGGYEARNDSGGVLRSLGAKLFVVVFAILLINFGVVGTMNIRLHRAHFEAARLRSAAHMTDLIRRSASYAMLRNDRATLEHILSTLGREPGTVRLRLTDDRGRVHFSTLRSELGSIIPSLRIPPPVQESRVTRSGGERVLVVTTPIPNAPSCFNAACHAHSEAQPVLGVLDVDVSLADADADVANASRQFIGYSAIAILVTILAIGLLLWHLVHEPVRALRQATQRVGAGELGVQIPVSSRDELGELAESFNEMSQQLHGAQEEITAWTHTLEERVERKTLELQRAHDQMLHAEKLTSLGKLAAVVAHEINNPLSGILTYAKLMRKWIERGDDLTTHTADMRDQLQLIENESKRCGDIARNLLTFARVPPMNITDVDMNAVVKQTLRLVEHRLDLGNITQRLELATPLPKLRGDASQLEQLLLALIMNAIDAMPREGTLRIATRVAPPLSVDRSPLAVKPAHSPGSVWRPPPAAALEHGGVGNQSGTARAAEGGGHHTEPLRARAAEGGGHHTEPLRARAAEGGGHHTEPLRARAAEGGGLHTEPLRTTNNDPRPTDNLPQIIVEVEDDGVGIPSDLLPRLFDPFVTTKSEEGKGVGLGLAISLSIVERHNGAISVHSEPGRGTKFTITLPAEKTSCQSANSDQPPNSEQRTASSEGRIEEASSSSTTSPVFATV